LKFTLQLSLDPKRRDRWQARLSSTLPFRILRAPGEAAWTCVLGAWEEPLAWDIDSWLASPETAAQVFGRFTLIHADAKTRRVSIWTDRFRGLGTFWHADRTSIWISNDLTWGRSRMNFESWDREGARELLEKGYVTPPRTLHRSISMALGFTQLYGETGALAVENDWETLWGRTCRDSNPVSPREVLDAFDAGLERLMEVFRPEVFRISGGVDSRLIAASLSIEARRSMKWQVVCSPSLEPTEDRDVVLAKRVADFYGQPLEVLKFPAHMSAYFYRTPEERWTLSGILGGELLGGVVYTAVPRILLPDSAALEREIGARRALLAIYLNSYRTSIYASSRFSWAHPTLIHKIACSPFTTPQFLDRWLKIEPRALLDYRLYRQVVRLRLPKALLELPFQSPIASFDSELAAMSSGVDPKSIPYLSEAPIPLSAQLLSWVEAIGIRCPPGYAERLMNLQNGLSDEKYDLDQIGPRRLC
jgi:hypothetical protein